MSHSLIHSLRHDGMVWRALYRPDGRVLATIADGKESNITEVRLWNPSTGKLLAPQIRLEVRYDWGDEFYSGDMQFSPDGTRLATGGPDRLIQFWDTMSGKCVGRAIKHRSRINRLAFHPSRNWILTGCTDKRVHVWDLDTGAPVTKPLAHKSEVFALEFSPDRRTLAVQTKGKTVQLWNAQSLRPIGDPLAHDMRVNGIRFSPVGSTLLTACDDRLIRFWNARTGALKRQRPLDIGGYIQAVAYSPDGTLLLTGNEHLAYSDNNCEGQLWNAKTGSPVGEPIAHTDRCVIIAAFSPNSRLAVTGSGRRLVVTTIPEGALVATLMHRSWAYDAHFSPDGRDVTTCCTDNFARIWRIKP
jgi:WD40 repeat protein